MFDRTKIPPEDLLIGSEEFALRLGCHVVTIYKKIGVDPKTGKVRDPKFPKPIRGLAGHWLKWRESDIRAYVAARERAGVTA